MADTAGLEPAASHCADIVVDAAGALPFKSYASCDSFLGYQLGEPDPGADGRPLLTRSQRFRDRTNPDRLFQGNKLLLTLESPSGLAATGSGLLGGFSQLF